LPAHIIIFYTELTVASLFPTGIFAAHHVPISSHPPSEGIFIGHGESPGLAEYEQSSNVACAVVVHEDLFGTILENNMTHPDTTDMEAGYVLRQPSFISNFNPFTFLFGVRIIHLKIHSGT